MTLVDPARDLLIDIDGVLYPFPERFTAYVQARLGRTLALDTSNWAFYEAWGLDHTSFVALLTEGVAARELWWDADVYDEVPAAIARLRAAGHRLHLVTARGVAGERAALTATRSWLERIGIEVDSLTLAEHKPDALDVLGLEPARCVAVDDSEHHVEAWSSAGVAAVVLDRWGSYRGALRSVPDLARFADLVHALVQR